MKLKPIINSLLETDSYKFSMGNVIFKQFNDYKTTWTFKCRNEDVRFTVGMMQEIREQLDHYCTLRFTDDEIEYLRTACPWLSEGYLNYLKFWHPVRNEIIVQNGIEGDGMNDERGIVIEPYNDCCLAIEARGTWLNTSMYEIAILAIVNEVYFAMKYGDPAFDLKGHFEYNTRLKVNQLKNGVYDIGAFSEFGLRRRLSGETHDWLIGYLKENAPNFVGTSNVYLAKKWGVKPVGTMAHEMGMAMMSDQRYNVAYVNERIMEVWTNEYGVKNGIFLTDVIGRDAFLADFNDKYATLFSGVRHDSGDPIEWGEAMIRHYEKLKINPLTKTLLFSDSLNFEKATKIKKHFDGRCNIAFGIGTYLAGVQNETPLNIVMKITECNGLPVCKLTDNPEKAMGRNQDFIDFVKRSINWRINH